MTAADNIAMNSNQTLLESEQTAFNQFMARHSVVFPPRAFEIWFGARAEARRQIAELQTQVQQMKSDWDVICAAADNIPAGTIEFQQRQTIVELQADVERLKNSDDESTAVCDRLSRLLAETALALKGESDALRLHSYHDIPELAATLWSDNDRLIAWQASVLDGYNGGAYSSRADDHIITLGYNTDKQAMRAHIAIGKAYDNCATQPECTACNTGSVATTESVLKEVVSDLRELNKRHYPDQAEGSTT